MESIIIIPVLIILMLNLISLDHIGDSLNNDRRSRINRENNEKRAEKNKKALKRFNIIQKYYS